MTFYLCRSQLGSIMKFQAIINSLILQLFLLWLLTQVSAHFLQWISKFIIKIINCFRRNEIEINRKKLFREYVQLYFVFDILASVPLDYLFTIIEVTPTMKYFRLLRLLKLYRIFELTDIIRQHTTLNIPIFRIGLLFISFIVIAHWFNCLLLFAARWEVYE